MSERVHNALGWCVAVAYASAFVWAWRHPVALFRPVARALFPNQHRAERTG